MISRYRKDTGASVVEFTLLSALVVLTAIGSVSGLRNVVDNSVFSVLVDSGWCSPRLASEEGSGPQLSANGRFVGDTDHEPKGGGSRTSMTTRVTCR